MKAIISHGPPAHSAGKAGLRAWNGAFGGAKARAGVKRPLVPAYRAPPRTRGHGADCPLPIALMSRLRFDLSDALWQDRREKGGESIPPATRLKDPREGAEHD